MRGGPGDAQACGAGKACGAGRACRAGNNLQLFGGAGAVNSRTVLCCPSALRVPLGCWCWCCKKQRSLWRAPTGRGEKRRAGQGEKVRGG